MHREVSHIQTAHPMFLPMRIPPYLHAHVKSHHVKRVNHHLPLRPLLSSPFPPDHPRQRTVLEELAGSVFLLSVALALPSHSHTFSPAGLEIVAGDAIVASGHGAGIAVGAGRIVVVRSHPMALAQ